MLRAMQEAPKAVHVCRHAAEQSPAAALEVLACSCPALLPPEPSPGAAPDVRSDAALWKRLQVCSVSPSTPDVLQLYWLAQVACWDPCWWHLWALDSLLTDRAVHLMPDSLLRVPLLMVAPFP